MLTVNNRTQGSVTDAKHFQVCVCTNIKISSGWSPLILPVSHPRVWSVLGGTARCKCKTHKKSWWVPWPTECCEVSQRCPKDHFWGRSDLLTDSPFFSFVFWGTHDVGAQLGCRYWTQNMLYKTRDAGNEVIDFSSETCKSQPSLPKIHGGMKRKEHNALGQLCHCCIYFRGGMQLSHCCVIIPMHN